MKPFKYLFLGIIFILFSFTGPDCGILKNGKFTYKNGKKIVYVEFNGNKHVEYHDDREYFIKSTIEWISDCEYYLTINESTLPNFPFKMGSKLHIQITKVRGVKVYYKSTLNKRSWEGKLVQQKE